MKSFTLKFYGKEKHDKQYCMKIYHEIVERHGITDIIYYDDYEAHVGFHLNGLFIHDNYNEIIQLYKKKSINKDKRVFWYFKDLPESETIAWLKYCHKRQNEYNVLEQSKERFIFKS